MLFPFPYLKGLPARSASTQRSLPQIITIITAGAMEHSIEKEVAHTNHVREESSKEAKEDLATMNQDIRSSSASSALAGGMQSFGSQTQNHHTAPNTQVAAPSQDTGGVRAGVMDLQTMQWIPLEIEDVIAVEDDSSSEEETAQESESEDETGT